MATFLLSVSFLTTYYVATSLRSYMATDYVATWLRGYMATWLHGFGATWLRGYVDTWLCAISMTTLVPDYQEGVRSTTIITCPSGSRFS